MAQPETIHLERYLPEAKSLVAAAQALADEREHAQVEPLHFLVRALERDAGVGAVLKSAGADPRDVLVEAESTLARITKTKGGLAYLSDGMLALLKRAEREAGSGNVSVEHLLNALAQELRGGAAAVLQNFGLGPGALRPHMDALYSVPRRQVSSGGSTADTSEYTSDLVAYVQSGAVGPIIGRSTEVRRLLQILERRQKCHPLLVGDAGVGKRAIVMALAMRIAAGDVPDHLATAHVSELDTGALVAGAKLRGEIEARLKSVFSELSSDARTDDAVLFVRGLDTLSGQGLVGSGVGEILRPFLSDSRLRVVATTTPEGLRKLQDRDPALLRLFTVLHIDAPNPDGAIEILRGVATLYETRHRVQIGDPAIVAAVRLAKRYVQDRSLPDSAIDLLDEAAARKRVELDGVPNDVDDAIRRLASVRAQRASLANDEDAMSVATRERLEQEIEELEPKVEEMRKALDSRRSARAALSALLAEEERMVADLAGAKAEPNLARAGELEHVRLPELRARLDKARDAVKRAGPTGDAIITEEDVAIVLGEWTGIPVAKMLESEADKLLKMEARLAERVVGQDEAIRAVARAVRRGRVGLRDPGRPIGSFLFLGPSGVGKTELAKALAEFLFDDEQAMTRLDMSEFMEKHMAQRLLGSPPGYVDSDQGGFLTEAVRRRPYSVLLFDEIEKAHADVFNLLLQVLDDGRLTDGRGRTTDFSNTVVIMTSNIGSKRIIESDPKLFESDEGQDAIRDVLRDDVLAFLRPEFINRVDDMVVFGALSRAHLRGIVDILLRRIEQMLEVRGIGLSLSDAAKDRIVELGFDPAFGARPLKRALLRHVQDPLAEEILSGGYERGSVIRVDVKGGEFVFDSAKRRAS